MSYAYLSQSQRDVLIEHVGRAVPMDRRAKRTYQAQRVLLQKKLLQSETFQSHTFPPDPFPRATILTEEGRAVVAELLADYADALVRAGLEEIAEIKGLAAVFRKKLHSRLLSSAGDSAPAPDLAGAGFYPNLPK